MYTIIFSECNIIAFLQYGCVTVTSCTHTHTQTHTHTHTPQTGLVPLAVTLGAKGHIVLNF